MIYPFILTAVAGLATLFGTIPIFIKIKNNDKLIAAGCSFASGVMICVSIVDLIPEGLNYLRISYNNLLVIIFSFIAIIIGIISAILLDNLVDNVSNSNKLFKVGILSMIVIILHNIPEGIITFIISNKNIVLGVSICIAIALHNIPEGISIAIPIYYSTGSKFRAIIYTFISAISELFGAILTYLFLNKYVNDTILGLILNFTAGIMLAISSEKLLPTGKSYDYKTANLYFIIGFMFILFTLLLNNLIS